MKRFAIVNPDERTDFEKEYHLPFGYSSCFVSFSLDKTLEQFKKKYDFYGSPYVIEEINDQKRNIIFKKSYEIHNI